MQHPMLVACALGLILCLAWLGRADDLLIADFEGPDWGDWTVTGAAFGAGPAQGTLPGQMIVTGHLGRGLVNSFVGGDGSTGSLTSPPFTLERPFINFLIGGGMHPGQACINLLVDGKVVRTATGPNDKPGGTERLEWASWEVSDLLGQQAVIQIVDTATVGWGHINLDHIHQSYQALPLPDLEALMKVEHRYLNLPVKTGAPVRRASLYIDDKLLRDFDIEFADSEPDFWAFIDLSAFQGQEIRLVIPQPPGSNPEALALVSQDAVIRGAEHLYQERYRPQFHFSSRRGWNNDPNGLVYHEGEWHLFYQHNPYGWSWGNMHWGHAVSQDLVHWEELPIALYPRAYDDHCFSGSAVIDNENTSGLGEPDNPVMAAFFTSTARGEAMAYSLDKGRTFIDWEGNPVVKHSGRDPKVIWYEPGGHWVMAVYDERPLENGEGVDQAIAFYTSPDLKEWEYASRIVGYFECPELFELPVQDSPGESRWVLYAASGEYAVGQFDGKQFTPDGPKKPYNWGNCFYASQTFTNVPPEDGRRIQICWGTMAAPEMPFNQLMGFPVELTLRQTEAGPALYAWPVAEIANLALSETSLGNLAIAASSTLVAESPEGLFDIELDLDPGTAQRLVLSVKGFELTYDMASQRLHYLDREAPVPLLEGHLKLRLLVDRTTCEVFGAEGRSYLPLGFLFEAGQNQVTLAAEGGEARLLKAQVRKLASAWNR